MHIDFRKTAFLTVAADISGCPGDGLPEVVLAGRSNSGKSSLINALAGRNGLARTGSTPGKTRLVVYFTVEGRMLIADLPGYGFASASRGEIRAFSSLADRYFQSGRPIRLALVLLDIRHEPSESDRLMLAFLTSSGIPFIPVLNKADKLSKAQCAKQMSSLRKWMTDNGFHGEPVPVSTRTCSGMEELAARIDSAIFPESV